MPPGGARPNSGPKKGVKYKATLNKEAAREALRQIVLARMDTLVGAQLANAEGLKFLMVREKATGKFLRVGKDRAERINPDEESAEVWEKEPSIQAFTDLMNRALDKPAEQEQHHDLTGTVRIIHELRAHDDSST